MSKFPLPPKGSLSRTVVFALETLAKTHHPMPVVGEPNQILIEAIEWYARQGFQIVVETSRPSWHAPLVRSWLREHDIDQFIHEVAFGRTDAAMVVDARGVRPDELRGGQQ